LRTPVDIWDTEDISASKKMVGIKGSPTWVRRISSPPVREGGPKFFADPDPDAAVVKALEILLG
jgi:hypothetical protein